ncbi:carboxy-S-adenosyl-L-methionine synthase CmoA [Desulfogranum mediterraneum]|uniref:carboxy-S-adenosyl-L-methionine synthase CmoA n=1 Tax=Desulfogranum mediterraneum TaxID=160661 RepID=UPI000409B4C3|nr:carboxy-S-adenosyl-L-methionine synthase CmoA [Desulfogranum mediterraneum]
MEQDRLFSSGTIQEDFTFNERVADVFDDMVNRSIPYYQTVIQGLAALLRQRLEQGTTIYDLGCSTGSTLLELSRQLQDRELRYVGIDNAQPMIDKARRKSELFSKEELLTFYRDDITSCPLDHAGAVICNYTLQFLRPITRQPFLDRIYQALPPGGLLLISEKTLSHAQRLNRDFIALYHQFKKRQGYSELEIAAKREALENVLIPFSVEENLQLLRRAGFEEIEIFFKWFNFTSFIALK